MSDALLLLQVDSNGRLWTCVLELMMTALFPDGTIPYKIPSPLTALTAESPAVSLQLLPPLAHGVHDRKSNRNSNE